MNDRYLFKAKGIVTGKWYIGFLIKIDGDVCLIEDEQGINRCRTETICNCAPFKDKNGKQIWRNDILMCAGRPKDLVKAAFGEFAVKNVTTNENIDQVIGWYYDVISKQEELSCLNSINLSCIPMIEFYTELFRLEVVGNTFDEPEFLET